MSDIAAPAAASAISDIPMTALSGPKTFGGAMWELFRAGWRPASGWSCAGVIFANGMVLPLARIWGLHVEPLDWAHLTPFASLLMGLGVLRTVEKVTGSLP